MKYVIHSIVIFDTTEYLLTLLKNSNTSIKLSNSAGRILEELIKHQHTREPITREYLFFNVWRKHGLAPSHGNLNQQISLIRKNFSLLTLDPMSIITIPKRGFKLKHQINIKILEKDRSTTHFSINDQNSTNKNKIPFLENLNTPPTHAKYTIAIFILIITVLSISITYFYMKNKNSKKLYLCKEINSCNICTFHQIPNPTSNNLKY